MKDELGIFVNHLIEEYDKVEIHNILFYSKDRKRDFALLKAKIEQFKSKYESIVNDRCADPKQVGAKPGEGHI